MAKTSIEVKLTDTNGNAFAIISRVSRALRRGGHAEMVDDFQGEAMSGDYDHVLQTAMDYVEVI